MEMRVVRVTDRFDAACRFYGEVLGWPVAKQWDADDTQGRGRIFGAAGGGGIEFIEGDTEPVSGVVVAVEVADATATAARLESAGVALDEPLTDRPWGHRNLAVVDPTGLRVVMFEVR